MPGRLPEAAPARSSAGGGLLATLLDALYTRLELIAVEFELHLRGVVSVVVWSCAVVVCLLLAVAFGLTAVVVALWDAHRVMALLGGSLAFVLLAALFGALVVRVVRRHGALLAGSLAQLRADRDRTRGAG